VAHAVHGPLRAALRGAARLAAPIEDLIVQTAKPGSRWRSVALLLLVATAFGANHVSARLAFDHGTGVSFAVAVRSSVTALAVLALMRIAGVSPRLPGATMGRALVVGLIVSLQSFCLYSAVARIPVALALLAFNTFPVMLSLLSWLTGGERPVPRALVAMPMALTGLAIALDVFGWVPAPAGNTQPAEYAIGVAFALAASFAMATVLLLTTRWLGAVDGRLRTALLMAVVAAVTITVGFAQGGFALPADGVGWLGLALLTLLYGSAITVLFTVLPRMGAVNNAAIMNFEPVAALAMGWLVLDQRIAASQIAGGLIVIAAIVVLTTGRR